MGKFIRLVEKGKRPRESTGWPNVARVDGQGTGVEETIEVPSGGCWRGGFYRVSVDLRHFAALVTGSGGSA